MKKQISKLSIKTDKIVNLSKNGAQAVVGGRRPVTDPPVCEYTPKCPGTITCN